METCAIVPTYIQSYTIFSQNYSLFLGFIFML